jgi:transglutaminase-like putative cysteine protease
MVFTLPSVEVGSILEYRWELRYDDEVLSSPDWDVQQPYYVRKAHYSFLPYKYLYRVIDGKGNSASRLLYTTMLPKDAKVIEDPTGKFLLDVHDIPAAPHEDYMPPLASVLEQVIFYYTPYVDKDDYWKHEGSSWSKEMDRFAGETKTLKDAVGQIVAPGDSEEVKAHKIYDAVMALENTDYTRRKSQAELKQEGVKYIKGAEGVWAQKSGSSDEIALLYVAMARIAGLKAYVMAVCDRNREVFNPFYLTTRQFNDILVVLSLGGKEIPIDPGEKFAPFAQLAWMHTMTEGIRQSDKGITFAGTPANPYKEAATTRMADVTIEKDGSVKGTLRITMSGPEALRWRHRAFENDEDEVKKQFNEYLHGLIPDGVNAEFDHFLGLEDYHSVLMGIAKLSGNMGTVTGKRVFLPGLFFESHAKHPFVSEETRETPVDMQYADSLRDIVTYHLPENFVVESAPPDATIPWAGHAVFQVKSTVDPANKNKVDVERSLARAFTMLAAKDYATLRDFYQKVATADQQQLVLTMTPAGKSGSE